MKLNKEQLADLESYLEEFLGSDNAASGSKHDSNANVTNKNLVVAQSELFKGYAAQLNMHILEKKIESLYGREMADSYLEDLNSHLVYQHDLTSLLPYCVSISMYPFLVDGLTKLGGESTAPKHLQSFCGSFVNLVFSIASQFAGAIATVEFLTYFDYFARKSLGETYMDRIASDEFTRRTVTDCLQQVVYCLNQPAGSRGYQSVFWNISIFDEDYFSNLFEGFVFPDCSTPSWGSTSKLQNFFLEWFNLERTKALLTFPVVTVAMLTKDGKPKSADFAANLADQMSKGNSFFIYQSDSADSLASCCRLRNEMVDNTFSYSLGAGGTMTGSINVMTININRLVQDRTFLDYTDYKEYLAEVIDRLHCYQIAYRKCMDELKAKGALTVYDAGFIDLDKQFLTLGINGMLEAAEFLGIEPRDNSKYRTFVSDILKVIYDKNKEIKSKTGYMFNTEFVPAESLGVKNATWDKRDGLVVPRDAYNSYFYKVEDTSISILEKFNLYDADMVKFLDGGSALHLNLLEHPDKDQWIKIIEYAASKGVQYWTYNVPSTHCKDCGHISKAYSDTCGKCESDNVTNATRIIGYLKEVSSFSDARKQEHGRRFYASA